MGQDSTAAIHTTLGYSHQRGSADWNRITMAGENVKNMIKKFLSDESGATAIEYGLIAAGISLAIIAVVNGLGTNLNGKFAEINTSLK
jgi:pilus assembly protein Flp/PilA